MNKSFIIAVITIFLFSCDEDEKIEIVKMRVNHYQPPVDHEELFKGLSFLVQEGDEIGNGKWYQLHFIHGFEYEPGFIYEIVVLKKHIDYVIDRPNIEYALIRTVSKTKVNKETTFDIRLTIKYTNGFKSLVTKNEFSKFSLFGAIEINCDDLCSALEENIESENGLIGTFKHIDHKTIQLLNLKIQDE